MKNQPTKDFSSHLQRIKFAKETASMMDQMHLAEKSMGMLWLQLFDQICMDEEASNLANIKDLATVLHKLLQNYRQLSDIQAKMHRVTDDDSVWTLSDAALQEIEDQLQLL